MRRLVATLACRLAGTRLYGKPLQNLDVRRSVSILEHQVAVLRLIEAVDEVVLGIAEGPANAPLVEFAERHGLPYILGDEDDVLMRLIMCAEHGRGTDAFRVTTESPFLSWERIDEAWRRHVDSANDVTVLDGVPLGTSFEIYTLESLQRSHDEGDSRHRSELCSLYVREHREEFQVDLLQADPCVNRPDIRLTVDFPEDLVVCRAIYEDLADSAPLIPLERIVRYWDEHADVVAAIAHLPAGGYWA